MKLIVWVFVLATMASTVFAQTYSDDLDDNGNVNDNNFQSINLADGSVIADLGNKLYIGNIADVADKYYGIGGTLKFDNNADGDLKDADDYTLYTGIWVLDSISDAEVKLAYYKTNITDLICTRQKIKGSWYVVTDASTISDYIKLGPAIYRSLVIQSEVLPSKATTFIDDIKMEYFNGSLFIFNGNVVEGSVALDNYKAHTEGGTELYGGNIETCDLSTAVHDNSDVLDNYRVFITKGNIDSNSIEITIVEETQIAKINNKETDVMGYAKAYVSDPDMIREEDTDALFLMSEFLAVSKGSVVDVPGTYFSIEYSQEKKIDIKRKVSEEPVTPVCTDSDGGKNYYVKGVTEGQDAYTPDYWHKVVDYCDTNGNIVEYYCDNNLVYADFYKCPNGCSDGACIEVPPTAGDLVALWHFDEGSGSKASDAGPYSNDGTIYGATRTSGVSGNALNFDGNNDYVNVPDSGSLDITSKITIIAWVYPRDNKDEKIVSKISTPSEITGRSYDLSLHNGDLEFWVSPDGSTSSIATVSTSAPSLNKWSQVAGVYDGSSLKIYMNGELKNSIPYSQGIYSGTADLRIGYYSSALSWSAYFNGVIDEVSIYNRALSDSEIKANFDTYKDSDNDGIPVNEDLCPTKPENYNGYQDTDGCPDVIGKQLTSINLYNAEGSQGQKIGIKGKLTDYNGKPLGGKYIDVYEMAPYEIYPPVYKRLDSAKTDSDGVFIYEYKINKGRGVYTNNFKAVFKGDAFYESSTDYATLVVDGTPGGIYVHLNEKFVLEVGQSAKVVDYKYMKITLDDIILPVETVIGAKLKAKISVAMPPADTPAGLTLTLEEGEIAEVFGATITVLDINSNKATFVVRSKAVEAFVDVEIVPKEETITYGDSAEYKIVIKDKHPMPLCKPGYVCEPVVYTYQVDVRNLPFAKKYPRVITLNAGETETLNLVVAPYRLVEPAKRLRAEREYTARGMTTIRKYIAKLSKTPASEGGGAGIAEKPSETTATIAPPKFGKKYEFNVYVKLKENPQTRDIAYAVLKIKPEISPTPVPPLTPPPFPGLEEVNVKLYKGWNLMSLPGKLVKFELKKIPSRKLLGFVYLKNEKRYVTIQQAERILGKEFREYLAKNAFWIYSYADFELTVEVDKELSYEGLSMVAGWNLVPITEDMAGGYLSDIKGSCEFERMYIWDAKNQVWIKIDETYIFSDDELTHGFIIKANNYCRLGGADIVPPTPPHPVKKIIKVPADYSTIQAAVDAAKPGDIIQVSPGIYNENVKIAKPVILRSRDGPNTTIIDGGGNGHVIAFEGVDEGEISGFKLINSGGFATVGEPGRPTINAGVFCSSSSPLISSNLISNNWEGIGVWGNSSPVIVDNNLVKNLEGIGVRGESTPVVTGNLISGSGLNIFGEPSNTLSGTGIFTNAPLFQISKNNISNFNHGIVCYSSCNISNNHIASNNNGIGICSSNSVIFENDIESNREGLEICAAGSFAGFKDNLIYHNNFIENGKQALNPPPPSGSGNFINYWYNPQLLEGNYWSDYTGVDDGSGTGKHAIAGDGIGDTLIPHPSANYDNYPFINKDGWVR